MSFSGVTFVLFGFVFIFLTFSLKPRRFVQSYFDIQAGAPIATRVFFCFFPFVYFEMFLFSSTFCTIVGFSLHGEYVVRSFLPDGVFLPFRDHGLDF